MEYFYHSSKGQYDMSLNNKEIKNEYGEIIHIDEGFFIKLPEYKLNKEHLDKLSIVLKNLSNL
jgi:hypothetical protein